MNNINNNNQQQYKILFISDMQLAPSGVAIQSNIIITNLLKRYGKKWKLQCLGAAIKHDTYQTIVVNHQEFEDRFVIKPIDGFGDPMLIRTILASEKPDALFLFTDPRFFEHIFMMEDEIHEICPIVYNTIWDSFPIPQYNYPAYESVDLLNCISKTTYKICSSMFPEKTNYVPHALYKEIYKTLPEHEVSQYKEQLLGEKYKNHFVAMWNSRNAKRKNPADVLLAWKMFLDKLEQKYNHRNALIIMHTDPLDSEGPNLYKVIEMLGINENVFISKDKLEFEKMNILYNASDILLCKSSAEGFGLSTLEALYAGTPVLTVKTGGQTDQIEDEETGEQFGIGLTPEVECLIGSQIVPYIYEHYVSNETYSNALMQIYEWGPEKRKAAGHKGQTFVLKNFDLDYLIETWNRTLEETILKFRANKDKPRFKMVEL